MPKSAIPGAGVAALALLVWGGSIFIATEATADAALFAENCVKCHPRASTLARSLKGATPAEKTDGLDKYLSQHHAADAAIRAKLVTYLVGLSPK